MAKEVLIFCFSIGGVGRGGIMGRRVTGSAAQSWIDVRRGGISHVRGGSRRDGE